MKDNFKDIELISHTQIQAIYNNKLLEKFGIDYKFPITTDILKKENFSRLEIYVGKMINNLGTDKYSILKDSLKSFKNCPGELFYKFIDE